MIACLLKKQDRLNPPSRITCRLEALHFHGGTNYTQRPAGARQGESRGGLAEECQWLSAMKEQYSHQSSE
ncbi:hypothetical protein DSM101010T_13880 [Desulfovibrio subterraneus]|uniref:Uncharacterized protein n=1 Tax=Desulfovibrio subterraneus TaxID=2718620 RepID=A0A7J0BH02_9BACT|nr:hypothetical protein DSM101010T_13880 [Desulfovibrio subterraneus]